MIPYADTSLLVALCTRDALSERARLWLSGAPRMLLVSDFARLEFASAIALKLRRGDLSRAEAEAGFQLFDRWASTMSGVCLAGDDIAQARNWLRSLSHNLRAPDALHLALAARHGAMPVTGDVRMASAAHGLGLSVTLF